MSNLPAFLRAKKDRKRKQTSQNKRRQIFEALEQRQLLAGDMEIGGACEVDAIRPVAESQPISDLARLDNGFETGVLRSNNELSQNTLEALSAAGYLNQQSADVGLTLTMNRAAEGESAAGEIALGDAVQDQLLSVLSSLDEAANSIDANGALNAKIPLLGKSLNELLGDQSLGDFLRFESLVGDYFGGFDPSSEIYNQDNTGILPTADGLGVWLTEKLDDIGAPSLSVGGGTFSATVMPTFDDVTSVLQFDVSVTGSVAKDLPFDLESFSAQFDAIGLSLSATTDIDFTTMITLDAAFGIDLSSPDGVDPFFDFTGLTLTADLDASGSSVDYELGPVSGSVNTTTLTADASTTVTFADGATPLSERLNVVATTGFDLDVGLDVFGQTANIAWSDSNVVDGINTPTIDLAALVNGFSAEHLVNGLLELADYLNEVVQPDDSASGDSIANTKIPLINKTVGELLSAPAEARKLIPTLSSVAIEDGFKRFTATLGGAVASQGIKLGDTVKFLSTSGERFPAIVDAINGFDVTLRYEASRPDLPNLSVPELEFQIGGSLGDQIKAALAGFGERIADGDASPPSIGVVLDVLAETMGLLPGEIEFDPTTKILNFTPEFSPEPLKYETSLDLAEQIPGLEFEASGDFMITATPMIRLPLGINLDSAATIPTKDRVFVIDDGGTPEVSISLDAELTDPQARASLGFLSVLLSDSTSGDAGITFSTDLTLDINEPAGGNGNMQATLTEILSDVPGSFDAGFDGSFDIDRLEIKPEVAGVTIPGEIDIFTTTNGTSTPGPAAFDGFAELKTLFDNVTITNTIGDFDALTPEDIVTMFIELGATIDTITDTLDVPDGIPFVEEALSGIVDFADITTDFARQLYFHPKVIAADSISVTDGVLSSDASFIVNIEGSDPVAVLVSATDTTDNTSIDDLIGDINVAIVQAGLAGQIVAEGQAPLKADDIVAVTADPPSGGNINTHLSWIQTIQRFLPHRIRAMSRMTRSSTCLIEASNLGTSLST